MLRFVEGNEAHVPACTLALEQSELGRRYFAAPGSAEKAVREGLGSGGFFVALRGDDCVGFIYYLVKGAFHAFPYIHLIVVSENARGCGVGGALMDFAEERLSAVTNKVFLVVADFNPDGERFYSRHGYTRVGVIPSLYREGVAEHLMMKRIGG